MEWEVWSKFSNIKGKIDYCPSVGIVIRQWRIRYLQRHFHTRIGMGNDAARESWRSSFMFYLVSLQVKILLSIVNSLYLFILIIQDLVMMDSFFMNGMSWWVLEFNCAYYLIWQFVIWDANSMTTILIWPKLDYQIGDSWYGTQSPNPSTIRLR